MVKRKVRNEHRKYVETKRAGDIEEYKARKKKRKKKVKHDNKKC